MYVHSESFDFRCFSPRAPVFGGDTGGAIIARLRPLDECHALGLSHVCENVKGGVFLCHRNAHGATDDFVVLVEGHELRTRRR